MKIVILILVYILIIVIDIPLIVPKISGNKKIFAVYGFIIISGFTISLLLMIKKTPTSPAKVIESIVKGIIGEL